MSGVFRPGYVHPKGALIEAPVIGILLAAGATVPSDAATGYAPGCLFIHSDGVDNDVIYVNEGTKASCDFNVVPTSGGVLATLNLTSLLIGGTTVDASALELNRAADLSSRIVNTTLTETAFTLAAHSDRILVVDAAAPWTGTLPAASGSGAKYTVIINTAATGTQHVITCGTLDILKGAAHIASSSTDDVDHFLTTATDDKMSLNGTTTGGAGGDRIEIIDSKLSIYNVTAWMCGTGAIATPFAAT